MTKAQKLAQNPTKALQAIADEVQQVADQSQSFAYRFEDCEDGSRIEIRCAPNVHLDNVPEGNVDHDGHLTVVDGQVLRVHTKARVRGAKAELAANREALRSALDQTDDEDHVAEIERVQAATEDAAKNLAANLDAGIHTATHVAIPADDKTVQFIDDLGPGGRAFIAH